MIWRNKARLAMVCTAGFAVATTAWLAQDRQANAADHNDPSTRVGMQEPEDIDDLYAWHSADGSTLSIVLTFAGPVAPAADQEGTYDPDVLYGIHIDNNNDAIANIDIWARFAQNDLGDWGVQVISLPGESDPVIGAVETTIDAPNGAKVFAGLRDDPFFFDLTGFLDTVNTGTLSFDATRDSFAGSNATALVLEVPVSAAIGAGDSLSIWATTSRL